MPKGNVLIVLETEVELEGAKRPFVLPKARGNLHLKRKEYKNTSMVATASGGALHKGGSIHCRGNKHLYIQYSIKQVVMALGD